MTHYSPELDAKLGAIQERKAAILADPQELFDAVGDYLEEPKVSAAVEYWLVANATSEEQLIEAAKRLKRFLETVAEWYATKEVE